MMPSERTNHEVPVRSRALRAMRVVSVTVEPADLVKIRVAVFSPSLKHILYRTTCAFEESKLSTPRQGH